MHKSYSCWLIHNIKFDGKDFIKKVDFKWDVIELLVTNYQNLKENTEINHIKEWLFNFVIDSWMMQVSSWKPLPINCVFLVSISPIRHDIYWDFNENFESALRFTFYDPIQVSTVGTYIEKWWWAWPWWNNIQNLSSSNITISDSLLDKVEKRSLLLWNTNYNETRVLEQIHKISCIDEVLIELLALYSFIEWYWHNWEPKSNFTDSFNIMLKSDYAPWKLQKDRNFRKKIKEKLEKQNAKFRYAKVDDMRHILAHWIYKKSEKDWWNLQWKTLSEQRNMLFDIIFESLFNQLLRECD